jgi:hypothetical protein
MLCQTAKQKRGAQVEEFHFCFFANLRNDQGQSSRRNMSMPAGVENVKRIGGAQGSLKSRKVSNGGSCTVANGNHVSTRSSNKAKEEENGASLSLHCQKNGNELQQVLHQERSSASAHF